MTAQPSQATGQMRGHRPRLQRATTPILSAFP